MALRRAEYMSLLRALFHRKTFGHAILGITWKVLLVFLLLWYLIQVIIRYSQFIQQHCIYDRIQDNGILFNV